MIFHLKSVLAFRYMGGCPPAPLIQMNTRRIKKHTHNTYTDTQMHKTVQFVYVLPLCFLSLFFPPSKCLPPSLFLNCSLPNSCPFESVPCSYKQVEVAQYVEEVGFVSEQTLLTKVATFSLQTRNLLKTTIGEKILNEKWIRSLWQ